jgi:hypothetical protein
MRKPSTRARSPNSTRCQSYLLPRERVRSADVTRQRRPGAAADAEWDEVGCLRTALARSAHVPAGAARAGWLAGCAFERRGALGEQAGHHREDFAHLEGFADPGVD